MELTNAYIPMDRRQALTRGARLPERMAGAALFADISGFTPLTEALQKEYGPKRGAEELTRQLNLIFDALVIEVHRYGGSVLAFSGDAITCWFDTDTGLRAAACGLAMQQAMGQFGAIKTRSGASIPLAMKVAVAAGPVRRFQVGDPQLHHIDTLAGATLDQMAEAEHHAEKGEVVVTAEVAAAAGDRLRLTWRDAPESGQRYGVVAGLSDQTQFEALTSPWPAFSATALSEDTIRPWLLPPIYERLRLGKGQFLAELRPAVILFLYFSGIDYDRDEAAGSKLDAYIRWVQTTLARYEGYIFQLTIGDKGSYLYTAFGAPIAHEDDAVRTVSAALELQTSLTEFDYIDELKIGISQGQIYSGAYGGNMRRTYGVLGDEVNLAARLMQAARPGQVLVSEFAREAAGEGFIWEALPAIKVKGKAEAINVFSANGRKAERAVRLQEPDYALPMVGRQAELDFARLKLELVLTGQGQIIGVTAEAGMGKSRLVAEIIRLAGEQQLSGFGGECQSYGTNISYLVWQPIWAGFFGLDPGWTLAEQVHHLEKQLEQIDPALLPRLPLLGAVLNLSIPDNDLTRSFDAKLRKTSLEALLVDCLRKRASLTPLLLVLEDCHWLDPLSHDLLEVISRAIVDVPLLLVLAYRPPEVNRLQAPRIEQLTHFTKIPLADFTPQEAQQLIGLKLAQFFGDDTEIPDRVTNRIIERAQGNPFYIEELLNYLQDQGVDPHDDQAMEHLDLPTTLQSLILSRIDRLTEYQKRTIKVASVIGRLFEAGWLWGLYPDLGEPERIKADLTTLSSLELTPLDTPEPELKYLFKHVVTQEVAYESLPYAMRALLHEQFGQFIEKRYSDRLDQYIDLLAFHYERSQNEAKKREYLRKAGEAAQAEYANEAAIDYYQRLLPLLPAAEQAAVSLKLGDVLQLMGNWSEAGQLYQQLLTLTDQVGDRPARAWCQTAMGELLRKQGRYDESASWFEQARTVFEELGDRAGVGQVLHFSGSLAAQQGDYEASRLRYEESLAIRRVLNDKKNIANLLNNLGLNAHEQGDFATAQELYQASLDLRTELADKWAIATSLNNLGYLALDQNDFDAARARLEMAVHFQREIGDRSMMADALTNLGNVAREQGDYATAQALYEESLTIDREMGNLWGVAYSLEAIGGLAARRQQAGRALRLVGAAEILRQTINAPLPPAEQTKLERLLEPVRQALGEAAAAELSRGRALPMDSAIDYALEFE